MNYPAVDAAEREEHNSFDHSVGTDSGLTGAAGNEFSEGLVSSESSEADLIAGMANSIRARTNCPASEIPVIISPPPESFLTITWDDSLKRCIFSVSTVPGTTADTWELVEKEEADFADPSYDIQH